MRSRSRAVAVCTALLGGAFLVGFSVPEGSPEAPAGVPAKAQDAEVEAIVDHRRAVMRAAGGHLSAAAAILMDGLPHEGTLAAHGAAVGALFQMDMPAFFPEGSLHEESEAVQAIWDDWDGFVERYEDTAERAQAFAEATQGGDQGAMIEAFAALGDSCGACHESFRE